MRAALALVLLAALPRPALADEDHVKVSVPRTAARILALEVVTGDTDKHQDIDRGEAEIMSSKFYSSSDERDAATAWLKRHAQDADVAKVWTDPDVEAQREREQGQRTEREVQ